MAAADALQIIPLGGLGEFGLNCALLQCGDDFLVIDAGLMFPTEDFLGVDIVVPDFAAIAERIGGLRGVILTHGHEDHIGAIPFLAPLLGATPVHGTPLTIGFARDRLRRAGVDSPVRLAPVEDGATVEAGPFRVEFLPAAHSIPDAASLAIRTPAGTVLHMADFKLDPEPVDGRRTDTGRISEIGREGVRLLMLDSTNAPRPGSTPSESSVGRALAPLFRAARGRIFVTCFSSNIHRLQQICDLAAGAGRRVALTGRSMVEAAETAIALGRLRIPPGLRADPRRVMDLPAGKVVVVASGSQGEPLSAMTRIALGEHPEIAIERGDLAILSSRAIPGNEMSVARLMDHLYRRGAEVVTGAQDGLHASGHASQDELRHLLDLARPEVLLPVHGSYRHLVECARLGERADAPPSQVLVAETGDIVEVSPRGARVTGRAPVGRVHIDDERGEVAEVTLRDRRHLSAEGLVVPVLVLDRASGSLSSPPEIISRGFGPLESDGALRAETSGAVAATVRNAGPEASGDRAVLRSKVIGDLRRFLRNRTGRRPLILPIVIEV